MENEHILFMNIALKEAQKAFAKDEVPVGAVIVNRDKEIIAKGYNCVERKQQQIAHAEIVAITKANKKMGSWRLEGCWLYVTLEPCAMCINLILLSRMEGVVFGAPSPKFGYQLDKEGLISLYRRNTIRVLQGVCEQESALLLKKFFQQKRVTE